MTLAVQDLPLPQLLPGKFAPFSPDVCAHLSLRAFRLGYANKPFFCLA
jgi:hypothetical protein